MYLSRIELNTEKYDARKAVASPQVMHALVEKCFTEPGDDIERKLWRLDMLHDKLYLLLLSPETPDFTDFIDRCCDIGVTGETKKYDNLLERVQAGQQWNFRLRGNTTHSKSEEEGKRGKLYPHVSTKYKLEWLMKKAPGCGFELNEEMFNITQTEQLRFWKKEHEWKEKNALNVRLTVAVFEGTLTITDSELFKKALTQGVGRAKAYGCGLLTIARTQS